MTPGCLRAAAARVLPVALGFLLAATAGAAELAVALEPETATVGDRVEAVLVLTAAPDELAGEPRFPAWGERWGGAEILEAGAVEREADGGALRFRQRLVLAAFRTGTIELPPKQVAVPGPAATAELWTPAGLALEIESVLPSDGGELEPRPPVPPGPLPLGRAFWSTLAALTALAGGAFLLARRRGGLATTAARPRTPEEELDAALATAGSAPAPEEGHVVLSLGLRRFLGHRFGFPAAESTTGEIRRQLRSRRCPPLLEGRIQEVLLACDRVKFAREPATRPALDARIEGVREIARGVDDHLRPPSEDGTARREEAA